MLKILRYVFIVLVFPAYYSQATLITIDDDVSASSYIQHTIGNDQYDIMWVNSLANQFIYCDTTFTNAELVTYLENVYSGSCYNQFLAPGYRTSDTWQYFEYYSFNVQTIMAEIGLVGFEDTLNGGYINGFEDFNTNFDAKQYGPINPFRPFVTTALSKRTDEMDALGANADPLLFNVFYIRESIKVSEPTTLIIFIFGLLALTIKKRFS